ncbi:MAG: Gfo/Idh/MocA family oxidoreductase [Trueperaceae bacterium]|nr:Gfo/Idh/MocA family oxidoreductase [Trueperaceae bacterium]MCO5173125.1 Gfo/Idh/MocA family oxidoreductase [Trueperaceae bacterium]MCW5818473.1 Gfo/Idh/MocA family oxidoreductase [Trueperaceae bacterium]
MPKSASGRTALRGAQSEGTSSMQHKVGVGVVGCGTISDVYLRNLGRSESVKVVAVADLDEERARQKAAQHSVVAAASVAELLAMPDVELILNLTVPHAHADVALQALRAGKSVYSEKPLATTFADGALVLAEAARRGLHVGCAPDTFLGAGQETCRELVAGGAIGAVVGAVAFMANHGMEHWHANPEFFYQPGAGPLFDIGPYYLTALVNLLGPVSKVAGAVNTAQAERPITSGPASGRTIKVGTPTHVSSLLTFESGAVATLLFSFDVWATQLPRMEVYGTLGTLSVPDPNTFGGPVKLKLAGEDAWSETPLVAGPHENSRGIGLEDMAAAMRGGKPHRASGELALHVLEVMEAILAAGRESRVVGVGVRRA